MNRTLNLWLMAAMLGGLSLGFGACKDDASLSEEEREQREMELLAQTNEAFNVLNMLANVSAADDDFLSKTYEPTIGKEDDGNSTTRIVNTNTMELAAERFANMADVSIDENTATYTWHDDNLGTMTYTKTLDGTSWATVDVNIKQVPHLQKIVYRAPEQANDNGKFEGKAYYRFGDVVSRNMTNKDGSTYTEYWICVRPAFGPEGKEDSYWACLNVLPEENIYEYKKDGCTWRVPTKLGTDKEQMQNLAEMLFAIVHPKEWETNASSGTKRPKLFNDFKPANLKYHNQYFWANVCRGWDEKNIWRLALNTDKDKIKNTLLGTQPNNESGLSLLYKGYSWMVGWNCTLYVAHFQNGTDKEANAHKATYISHKQDMREFNDKGGIDFSTAIGDGSYGNDFFSDYNANRKEEAFISDFWPFRVLTGKKLSDTGRYDKLAAIHGTKDVYRYYSDIMPESNMLDDPEETEEPLSFSALEEPMVGCLLGSDGKFYVNKTSAEDNGTRPVAIVCTLNGKKRVEKGAAWNGLAMALAPIDSTTWTKGNLNGPCVTETVNTIAEMSNALNGIAATKQLAGGCGTYHEHPMAVEIHWYDYWDRERDEHYELKNSDNFSNWFLPSIGQWILAYKGFGYSWTGQGYDMNADAEKMRNLFIEAGLDIPDRIYANGKWTYPTYWTSTQNSNGNVLMCGFGTCFSKDLTKPYFNVPPAGDQTDVKAKAIPFIAFKYNGGATED